MRHGWIGLGVLLAALCTCAGEPRPVPTGPSVLVVTIDTLRADHLGVYGHERARTPAIDGLAAAGVRFSRAFATTPLTLPSHSSIMTGLYPPRHGARDNGIFRLAAENVTLAERLSELGYDTAAVVGAFVLERRYGMDQGFATYDDGFTRRAFEDGFLERPASEVADRAIAWLENHAERPFFLWAHFFDPHAGYAPPAPYDAQFSDAPYDGEIAYTDAQLGRILAWLAAHGRDDVVVVVTSDHGESLGEHREDTHGYGLYDATLAVPLLVRGPGVPAGRVVSQVVSNAGVTPLILDLVGAAIPEGLDGHNLARFWAAEPPADSPPVYAETLATRFAYGWAPLYAIRTQRYHYVRAPRPELYDVEHDPAQLRNLLAEGGSSADSLLAVLDPVRATLDGILQAQPDQLQGTPLTDEERRNLEALGYLRSGPDRPSTAMDPKDGLRWLRVFVDAKHARSAGDYVEAESLLRKALAVMPESRDVLHEYALLAMDLGRNEEALAHAERALELSPASSETRALVGVIALEMGDEDYALRMLEAAERSGTAATPVAAVGFMWMRARKGDLEAARAHEEAAKRYISLGGGERQAHSLLVVARTWEHLGEHERALANVRFVLERFPEDGEAHMEMAIHAARAGDTEAVARHLASAGTFRRDPKLWNRLGIVYAARGEREQAEREFTALLEAHPRYVLAERNLALVRKKDLSEGR